MIKFYIALENGVFSRPFYQKIWKINSYCANNDFRHCSSFEHHETKKLKCKNRATHLAAKKIIFFSDMNEKFIKLLRYVSNISWANT